ncbi:MAG: UbiD family decarboxylase [Phycisphaerae bacterium]
MPSPDLQTFVRELEQRGWLKRVRVEVDPILEITEVYDRVVKAGGPALLFENVKGSRFPVLINTFGTRERMCLALGADSLEEIAERVKLLLKPEIPTTLMDKLKKLPQLIQLGSLPPKMVRRGVCQEVVHTDDADLTALPAIKCWPGDGILTDNVYAHIRQIVAWAGFDGADRGEFNAGRDTTFASEPLRRMLEDRNEGSEHARELFAVNSKSKIHNLVSLDPAALIPPSNDGRYLTLTNVFTKHPETGERNVGMYRVQVLGPKLAAMHWHMHHDGARHFRAYRRLGRRMPIAISFGGPAVMPYAATCPLPPGIDECLFAGFLNGGAIELVPCASQPEIEAPASAEFVVEGYIDPADPPVIEGPFGDHTGFYSLADLYPRLHVTAITHRREPIFPATVVGKPPQEDFWLGKATERIFLPMLQMLIPDILDYNLPMFGCFHNCAFVKIRKEYPFQARRVMSAIWGAGQMAFTKIIVVVDHDVDVQDEQAVLFHLCANVDPKRDVMFVDGPLDILDHAAPVCGAGSKMGIDATRKIPGEGAVRAWPAELEMSREVKERVTRRWGEYGI